MSASGYKRTYSGQLANVRFTPESRHYQRKISSVPESGHRMSASPPKADIDEATCSYELLTSLVVRVWPVI